MATMSPHGSAVTLTAGEGRTEATLITKESEGLRTHRSGGIPGTPALSHPMTMTDGLSDLLECVVLRQNPIQLTSR